MGSHQWKEIVARKERRRWISGEVRGGEADGEVTDSPWIVDGARGSAGVDHGRWEVVGPVRSDVGRSRGSDSHENGDGCRGSMAAMVVEGCWGVGSSVGGAGEDHDHMNGWRGVIGAIGWWVAAMGRTGGWGSMGPVLGDDEGGDGRHKLTIGHRRKPHGGGS